MDARKWGVRVARKTWTKLLITAALSVSVGLLLSGCVATAGNILVHVEASARKAATNARNATAGYGKPTIGQCWRGTYKDDDGYANWNNSPPVKCSTTHQLYTFAVPKLESTHKGTLFDKSGYAKDPIWNDAYTTCSDAEANSLPTLDYEVQRVLIETYLPEEKAWNAGARWVRCDVAVVAVGSPVEHPTFENLPSFGTLTDAIYRDAKQFDFCVNGSSGVGADGPKGPNAVYADCSKNPQWRLEAYTPIQSDLSGPLPSATDLNDSYVLNCQHPYTDATHITYVYFPTKSDWTNGDNEFECWVGRR
jgi:hypothetical protein